MRPLDCIGDLDAKHIQILTIQCSNDSVENEKKKIYEFTKNNQTCK